MFIKFDDQFVIAIELSEPIKQYLRLRYFGFTFETFNGNVTHSIMNGAKLTDKPHEIIRPPVAKGIRTFLFDTMGNTLSTNLFENAKGIIEIVISANFNVAFLCNFIEYLYYLHIRTQRKTIIHCSAFQIDNINFICPAGRNTGKTNILLESLASGGKYLADDWLIYGPNGELQIFPKAINIQSYNIPTVRAFDRLSSFVGAFKNIDELSSITSFFSKETYEDIMEQSQLFIPYQNLSVSDNQVNDKNKNKQKFVWLIKGDLDACGCNISKIDNGLVRNHILATRKLEHYPFELWRLVAVGLDSFENIYTDEEDYFSLQNIIDEYVDCYKVIVPSQNESSDALQAIRQISDE